uniref:Uncharacterized protein n=2 Tax=Caenorhabditis japonica TaxID=281687 RepID=A0A8R1ED80_CAEJA
MMKCGATNMKIIEDCDKLGDDYRLSHLVPADLSYIRKVNFIPEGLFHEEDLQSVKLRVEKGEKEDGIHHFEEPDKNGSGFRLVIMTPKQKEMCEKYSYRGICIDDTHNSTKYSLKLTTMMIVDGQDRGIPAGY